MKGKYQGFTLIEMLLVLGLMGIIFTLTIPISYSLIQQNNTENAQESFSTGIRTAHSYAKNNYQDDSWSIRIESSEIIVFKGNDFITRDTSYDEKYPIVSSVNSTGLIAINFEKSTGTPDETGTTTFSSGIFSESLSINSIGVINY